MSMVQREVWLFVGQVSVPASANNGWIAALRSQ